MKKTRIARTHQRVLGNKAANQNLRRGVRYRPVKPQVRIARGLRRFARFGTRQAVKTQGIAKSRLARQRPQGQRKGVSIKNQPRRPPGNRFRVMAMSNRTLVGGRVGKHAVMQSPWQALRGAAGRGAVKQLKSQPGVKSAIRQLDSRLRNLKPANQNNIRINVNHMFRGEINKQGRAVGFHHRGSIGHKGHARLISRGKADKNGVYAGQIQIYNPKTGNWVNKKGDHTFFPDKWSRMRVLREVRSAVANPVRKNGNLVEGISRSGVKIRMRLNKNGSINTAYPVPGG